MFKSVIYWLEGIFYLYIVIFFDIGGCVVFELVLDNDWFGNR